MKTSKQTIFRAVNNLLAVVILLLSAYFYYKKSYYFAHAGLVSALAILTPQVIYHKTWIKKYFHKEILTAAEVLLTASLALNALGAVWFYNYYYGDDVAHFLIPLAISLGLALIYLLHRVYVNKHDNKVHAIIFACVGTMFFDIMWEVFEVIADHFWHTGLSGQWNQPHDTFYDIMDSALSLPFSSIIIYKYWDYFVMKWKKIF